MANWKYKVNVVSEWKRAKQGEISTQELATILVRKLKTLPPYLKESDPELLTIVEDFESLADDSKASKEEFDEVWERLYEWGDITLAPTWPPEKMCWIATV